MQHLFVIIYYRSLWHKQRGAGIIPLGLKYIKKRAVEKQVLSVLQVITNNALVGGDLTAVVAAAAQAGADVIQLREKNLTPRELYALAQKIQAVLAERPTRLVINGSVEVALAVNAAGVHLGYGSLPLHVARRLLPDKQVGVSVHTLEEAMQAQRDGADYVIAGHIFATACKAGLPPRGLQFLAEVCQALTIPVFAIGGIVADNAALTIRAGAAGIAVMSTVMAAADPAAAVAQLKNALARPD